MGKKISLTYRERKAAAAHATETTGLRSETERAASQLEKLVRQNDERAASDKARDAAEASRWSKELRWVKLNVAGLYLAAFVALAAIATTHREMTTQQEVMQGQLSIALADQRPWVSFEPSALYHLVYSSDGQVSVPLSGVFQNSGKTPAENVIMRFKAYALSKDQVFKHPEEQLAMCKEARAAVDAGDDVPTVLFPNKPVPTSFSASIPKEQIQAAWPAPDDFSIRIVGCIDYTFSIDRTKHGQSGFSYDIAQPVDGGAHMKGFNPNMPPVPAEAMGIFSDWFNPPLIK